MKARNGSDRGRYATALLATTYVLLSGLAVCSMIVLTSAGGMVAVRLLLTCIGTTLLLWVLAWILRDRRTSSSDITNIVWLAHRRKARAASLVYKPRVRRDSPLSAPAGGNAPPTVEQLREISQNVNTWVPSRTRAARFVKAAEAR
ncbi:MAG: hypothetical protein AB7O26_06980 [Planctomycetaceae bacterium]